MKIALRLEMLNLGMRDQDIAAHIGMSSTSYSLLKKTKIFAILKNQYMTGVLSEADTEVATNFSKQREILQRAVPVALENLYRLAQQKIDQKLQFEASKEILDRDGRHAKVSRIGIPTTDQDVATPKDNEVATEIVEALQKQQAKNIEHVPDVTDIKDIDSPPLSNQVQ